MSEEQVVVEMQQTAAQAPTYEKRKVKAVDREFMDDASAAMLLHAPQGGRLIIWLVGLFIFSALLWANWAELDEVTKGSGKVIPSSQIQVIQNLEGGILSELLVNEGDTVKKGQVLLQIDDTRFSSSLRETQVKSAALKSKVARLQAEADGKPFEAPTDVGKSYPDLVNQELTLFQERKKQMEANSSILKEQAGQIKQEITELKSKQAQLRRSLQLVRKELDMNRPLVDAGVVSEVELLRIRKEVNDLKGELDATTLALPRARSRLKEAEKKVSEIELRFRNDARTELNDASAELSQLEETSVALVDRVKRTAVRSPVQGTVKRLLLNTVGGVIQPGMELMEIVPMEDSLLIEAKVSPRDIAFIHPGQKSIVKITSYDFSIYGSLEGKVEQISADSIKEERSDKSYYLVKVRTEKTNLDDDQQKLPIIPGMQAEVDILTGKKTVLEYLLKPVLRAKGRAMRER